jgi:hypothetical protein
MHAYIFILCYSAHRTLKRRVKQENLKIKKSAKSALEFGGLFCFVVFCCLEQVFDSFLPVLLRQGFRSHISECFFWAPFDALRLFGFVVSAAVACEHNFLFRMHVHGAELASADAPSAAVAGVLVNADYA